MESETFVGFVLLTDSILFFVAAIRANEEKIRSAMIYVAILCVLNIVAAIQVL